jgi:tRNA(His) guanylyltransferase
MIGNLSRDEAHSRLKCTFSKDKNEILYSEYNINYNSLEEVYKKGTILLRKPVNKKTDMIVDEKDEYIELTDKLLLNSYNDSLSDVYKKNIFLSHEDMIKDEFWKKYELDKY